MSDVLQFIGIVLVGVLTGILSGMFGVGGAVISTPAVRALGATPSKRSARRCRRSCHRPSPGTLRYLREGLVAGGSSCGRACSVFLRPLVVPAL